MKRIKIIGRRVVYAFKHDVIVERNVVCLCQSAKFVDQAFENFFIRFVFEQLGNFFLFGGGKQRAKSVRGKIFPETKQPVAAGSRLKLALGKYVEGSLIRFSVFGRADCYACRTSQQRNRVFVFDDVTVKKSRMQVAADNGAEVGHVFERRKADNGRVSDF